MFRFLRSLSVVPVLALLLVMGLSSVAQGAPQDAPAALGWDKGKQGEFVTALMEDASGDIWAATEDKGVWRYTSAPDAQPDQQADGGEQSDVAGQVAPAAPVAKRWINYSVKDGLGDDTVYALTQDRKGRIWAGTLRNGVSVWNGQRWQNYGLMDGPLGERVFALATSPSDGDVWMATNAGLARYSLQKDTWRYYTRAEGLPSDQIQAIAFDSIGTLYAGTQCNGLAIAKGDDYKEWRTVPGASQMPLTATGQGLPSAQINDVMVADDDTVYVATTCGLARSKDFGDNWTFIRGEDWHDKVENQRSKPQAVRPQGNQGYETLREDYVTNLGEDTRGLLYIGYRVKGYEIRRPLTDRVPFRSAQETNDSFPYVGVVLPMRDGRILLANYGTGLTLASGAAQFVPTKEEAKQLQLRRNWKTFDLPQGLVVLPTGAAPPTQDDLKALLQKVSANSASLQPGDGYYETEDWRTWGDWVGRYGTRYAVLCAAGAPLNHYVINDPTYDVKGFMGPNFPGNSLRHWIHWKQTENPRVLYNPLVGYRREAEWDDNGETMSMNIEGPDVWSEVVVPAGTHRLSVYFFNKDGHDGSNRLRDYLIELKKGEAKNVEEADKLPTQASARVRDFWGGVYKRFVVQGPSTIWLKTGRNNSFNTIVNGVFLDKIAGPPTRFETRRTTWLGQVRYEVDSQAPLPEKIEPPNETIETTQKLWAALNEKNDNAAISPLQWSARVLTLRAAGNAGWINYKPTPTQMLKGSDTTYQLLLRHWRWETKIWAASDRSEWQDAMGQAFESLVAKNPDLKRIAY